MSLYSDFYWKRKELMRLRNIYKKREERAKKSGLYNATYLSEITPGTLGYKTPTANTKPGEDMDLFSLDRFLGYDERLQKQHIIQLERKIGSLQDKLNNSMSSLRGMKKILKDELKVNKIDLKNARVRAKLENMQSNKEGWFKHAQVKDMFDKIDARTDLTDDEKKTLKTLIRARLSRRERVDYDDSILEWNVDIDELLKNPKKFLDRLSEGIPDDVLEELLIDAESYPTTDNPAELGF